MNTENENSKSAKVVVWDAAVALERLGGDQELFHEVVGIFLEEIPGHLATLRKAIHEGDAKTVEITAHSLKGEMGYLGITDLVQKAGELERLGRESELNHAPKIFAAFDSEISVVIKGMRRHPHMG